MTFLDIVNGVLKQIRAITSSAGSEDAGKIIATDETGRIDDSLLPVGVGDDAKEMTAGEALAAGDFVNVYYDSGETEVRVRKADASAANAGKRAHGFVLEGASTGEDVKVYFEGTNTQLTGLAPGVPYYLSGTSAGDATDTPPSTAEHTVQNLGVSLSATEISFEPASPVVLAPAA